MSIPNKIVVFTGDLAYSVRKGIVELDRSIPNMCWLIVIHSPKKTLSQLLRNQWRNLLRNGWRWIPYQIIDILQRVRSDHESPINTDLRSSEYTIPSLKTRHNLRLLQVTDIHAENTIKAVTEFEPDLGLALAAPILSYPLYSIPRLGTVNLHKGKVPDYRGMPPAFWELWNDEKSVGCTVHWVDDKLDTGNVVAEEKIECDNFATVRGLQLHLDELGVDLICKSVGWILQGTLRSIAQNNGGKTYRKPTLSQITMLNRKLMHKQTPDVPRIRQLVKNTFARSVFDLWRIGLSSAFAPRITVLLYHRVTDNVRDNLTVGIEQFDRHMLLIRKYCQPISIEDVLNCETIRRTRKPFVCITFDDGYLDNYINAAPILLRHGIPAAFFVSTGMIETNNQFPHDLCRGNYLIPMMNWHHLNKMHESGFTIGSHTVKHIDCAVESEENVWTELIKSREDLQRKLVLEKIIFAYPYGGRQHMTPERLELVKKAGYSGCLSAYGGTNIGKVDPFNVLRRGIHWEFSDQALLFSCLGLT